MPRILMCSHRLELLLMGKAVCKKAPLPTAQIVLPEGATTLHTCDALNASPALHEPDLLGPR